MAAAGGNDASGAKAPGPVATGSTQKSNDKGGSKLVSALSILNLLVTLGILGVLFVSFQKDKKRPSIEDINTDPAVEGEHEKGSGEEGKGKEGKETGARKAFNFSKMVTLEQFTINLSTPGTVNPKFVRVTVSVEVLTEDTEKELTAKMPQVRNSIIDLFNSKRPADLATVDGREYIKEEIKNALNSFLMTGKVKGIYFTNFALSG